MRTKLFLNKVYVKKSSIHGYGVFAGKKIRKGETIEECCFVLNKCDEDNIIDFLFEAGKRYALLFGYGSLYNHSDQENADYTLNLKTKVARFVATRTIQKDEEIFVNYGDEWFSSRDLKKRH
jgi:hypothetical protein